MTKNVSRSLTALLAFLAVVALTVPGSARSTGGNPCQTSGPDTGAYTLTVCITAPSDGASLAGDATVSGTVSVSGASPGVQRAVFFLAGEELLTDFVAPYTFSLPTDHWADGARLIEVEALARDGFISARAGISIQFANGITQPPVNTRTFTPKTGTTPAPERPFTVAATGDGAGGEPGSQAVIDRVASWNPNLFLYLGDIYEEGTYTEAYNWYGHGGSFFDRFRAITNPTVGNHEYIGSDAPGYVDYWDNVPHYYSFNSRGWHFIALDSTSNFAQGAPGSAQYQWLLEDLNANTATCTLAYWHHPVYNIGPQGDSPRMNDIWALLAQHGVDVALTAHDHDYQRWVPLDGQGAPLAGGITQFVVGTGGHGTQDFARSDSRVAAAYSSDLGALRLDLGPDGAGYQFVAARDQILDSGSVQCSGSGADATPPSAPSGLTDVATQTNVDLAWSSSTDNVGVTGYDVYRNGALLASIGPQTSYSDAAASPQTTYAYFVRARDQAGNTSTASNTVTVTTPAQPVFFSDGFESGDLSNWTSVTGLTTSGEAFSGSWGARATSTGAATWAYRQLASGRLDLYYRLRFKILSQASTVNLIKFRTGTGTSLLGVYVSSTGKLSYRNDFAAVSTSSTTNVSLGAWHELQEHVVINGTAGQTETWFNGVKITALSKTESFGTTPVGRVQLGENSLDRTYDIAYDAVAVATTFIADTSSPSGPDLTLSENGASAHVEGTTVYYDPAPPTAQSFVVEASTTDADSGISLVSFPAVFGADSSVDRTKPYSATYFWSAGSTASGPRTVRSTNGVGLTSTSTFTLVPDAAPPSGGSIAYFDGFVNTASVSLELAPGVDAASGVDDEETRLERAQASLAGGACGTFGAYTAIEVEPEFDHVDTTAASGRCYRYRYVVPDRVGNEAFYSSTAVAKVDADAPAVSLDDPGAVLSGTATLTASASDTGGTGVSSVTFQHSPAGTATWTTIATDASAPYSAVFDTTQVADGDYDLRAVADDGAGNSTASSPRSVAVRNGAVSITITAPATYVNAAAPNPFTITAATPDALMQVEFFACSDPSLGCSTGTWVSLGTDTAGPEWSASWNVDPDGNRALRAMATNASGATAVDVVDVTIDRTAPSGPLTAPTAGQTLSGSVTVASDSSDAGTGVDSVDFQASASGAGSWTTFATDTSGPWEAAWNTSGLADGDYDLRAVTADGAGNLFTSTVVGVTVDNNAPTVSISAPVAYVNGADPDPYPLTAVTPDQDIDTVAFYHCSDASSGCSAGTWISLGSDVTAPYSASWPLDGEGNRALRAVAMDRVGQTGQAVADVLIDRTAPSGGSISYTDGYNTSGSVAVTTADGTDGGSGIAPGSGVLQRDAAVLTASGCGAFAGSWTAVSSPDTSVASARCYVYRYRVPDRAGNITTYTSTAVVKVDTSAPSAPANLAASVAGPRELDLSWSASSDDVAVSAYVIRRGGAVLASVGAGTTTYSDTTVNPQTTYTYTVAALDAAGNGSAQSSSVSATTPPAVFTFTAIADAYINANKPNSNYGSITALRLDSSPETNSYLRFQVAGVGGQITRATLRVFVNNASSAGFAVHAVASNTWLETSLTYANAPPFSDPTFLSGAFSAGTWVAIPVTALVSGNGDVSVALTTAVNKTINLSSRETASAPQLVIETP